MLTETRQTLRQTARGAAHFFDLGGPSQYWDLPNTQVITSYRL